MDDLRISLEQEMTETGLKITVKLLDCTGFGSCKIMDSDHIIIDNDTLNAIAGTLD
jgi:hypothetical protein